VDSVRLLGEVLRAASVKAVLPSATADALAAALDGIKGQQRATSRDAEQSYDALNKYGVDLTNQAAEGKLDPVIGRDGEVRRLVGILSRRTKNNAVLVGPGGVGKTAIVEGLAQRIVAGDVPTSLQGRRLVSVDMAALMAGAS